MTLIKSYNQLKTLFIDDGEIYEPDFRTEILAI